jgi:aminoglycoside/choline kinase family phosphotransferase
MSRDRLIAGFLRRHGYAAARTEPLAQDASFRRYLRLVDGPRPAVLMDAPPPEDIRPFVRIARHLAATGVSVPEIYAADAARGLLLEEDLGDDLLSPTPLLLREAIDALIAIQGAPLTPDLPAWDTTAMAATALGTLFDWWWPATFGVPAPDAARQEFADALETMLRPVADGPVCFVHRDYFAGNLLLVGHRSGLRRIGVIDFQGAAIGHPAYDLASLLQDARRDIPSSVAEEAIAYYLSCRPELAPAAFRSAYAACAAQRHLRIVGQWVRLARRDGRRGYLAHGPRTWRLLQEAVQETGAAPLAAALQHWIPPDRRSNPPDLAA